MTNETPSGSVQGAMTRPPTAKPLSVSFNAISRETLTVERRILAKAPIAPAELAEIRAKLCAYLVWANTEYAALKIQKNRRHRAHRDRFKRDRACEADWLAGEAGELYIALKYLRQTLDRLQSSVRTLWEDAQRD
jgi:hypothetical protein